MKIYSNKDFSQLPKFLRNEQVVPDSFRKFVRKFWKTLRLKQCIERNKSKQGEGSAAHNLGRPTRARDKKAVTIPTV